MRKSNLVLILLMCISPLFAQNNKVSSKGVSFVTLDKDRKVEVYVDGKLFTSYIYPTTLEKPVLWPIATSKGSLITRGFPLDPKPGERVDHPHHVGLWFNYGDVNGLDFWNNSYAIGEKDKPKFGSIVHNKVIKASNGAKEGVLTVQCNWVDNNKNVLLTEETSFVFSGDSQTRRIIRITKLTANTDVKFGDNKEGMYAIRVDRAFEQPSTKPEVFTDASGKPTKVPVLNNEGVNGAYRSSDGKEKDDVWGTRGKWVALSAVKDNDSISVCILDHSENFGYPAHWHARGYGLFSVNNIGSKVYNPADSEGILNLKRGESVTFKHLVLIKSNGFASDKYLNQEFEAFSRK